MPADAANHSLLFEKFNRQLEKMADKQSFESVHRFRRTGRRVEILLDELLDKPDPNSRKLMKQLARLRRKAGQVRDLDLQIAALRNLKIPEGARHKAQLLQVLSEEKIRREKKLAGACDRESVREIRRRLKRAERELDGRGEVASNHGLLLLARIGQQSVPFTERDLHETRVLGKRVRYLLELSGGNVEMIQALKSMQDEVGDWHDWFKLTERAKKMFGDVPRSPLVSALRNVTQAKFRRAGEAVKEARIAVAGKKLAMSERAVVQVRPASA